MSTRGNICIKVHSRDFSKVNKIISCKNYKVSKESPYLYIYNHFDSYPKGLGVELTHNYSTYRAALNLVLSGDCSFPEKPYTDRGELFVDNCPRVTDDKFNALQQEYLYVFERGRWEGYDSNGDKLGLYF